MSGYREIYRLFTQMPGAEPDQNVRQKKHILILLVMSLLRKKLKYFRCVQ